MPDNPKPWDLTFGIKRKINRENWGKTCPKGHEWTKENTYWLKNAKPYPKRQCRVCQKERKQAKLTTPEGRAYEAGKMRRWREKNPERAKAIEKRSYDKRNKWIQSFKTKCKFCEETHFSCLDFHHRDSGEKLANIGQVRHWSHEKLLEEMNKCDIVCANCHRKYHWEEKRSLTMNLVNS